MSLVLAVIGVGLLLVGRWGWRQPGGLVAQDRDDLTQRRTASMRRGGAGAMAFGVVLLVGAVVTGVAQ